jgi:O-antigen ligase
VFGVGEAAIIRAVEAGELPPWATHGHNLYIDTLVRYGIIGVAVTVVLLGVVTVLAFGRLRRGLGGPLAMLMALGITTVAEIVFDWRYPMVPTSILLMILLLSIAQTDGRQPVAEEPEAARLDRGVGVA